MTEEEVDAMEPQEVRRRLKSLLRDRPNELAFAIGSGVEYQRGWLKAHIQDQQEGTLGQE